LDHTRPTRHAGHTGTKTQVTALWADLSGTLLTHRTLHVAPQAQAIARNAARAIEIGGPSSTFQAARLMPVYPHLRSIDNVNFAGETLWETDLRDGGPFAPAGERQGTHYLREAGDLHGIADGTYDVVLSSHTLEHLANPLLALREWRRVTSPDGHLLLVLPHRDGTFDRRRPTTPLQHLRDDEASAMPETDETHFDEIRRLHDLRRDPDAGTLDVLHGRLRNNLAVRAAHHHVFTLDNAVAAVEEAGWAVLAAEARRPYDQVIIAKNTDLTVSIVPRRSPFRSDRRARSSRVLSEARSRDLGDRAPVTPPGLAVTQASVRRTPRA